MTINHQMRRTRSVAQVGMGRFMSPPTRHRPPTQTGPCGSSPFSEFILDHLLIEAPAQDQAPRGENDWATLGYPCIDVCFADNPSWRLREEDQLKTQKVGGQFYTITHTHQSNEQHPSIHGLIGLGTSSVRPRVWHPIPILFDSVLTGA